MIFTAPTIFDASSGMSGPNDGACKALSLEKSAESLRTAIEFHVGYSHSNSVTEDHPLVQAMKHLAEEHKACVHQDNRGHDPELFAVPDAAFVAPKDYWDEVSNRSCRWCDGSSHGTASGCPGPPGISGAL